MQEDTPQRRFAKFRQEHSRKLREAMVQLGETLLRLHSQQAFLIANASLKLKRIKTSSARRVVSLRIGEITGIVPRNSAK
jgi:hypothetical protein